MIQIYERDLVALWNVFNTRIEKLKDDYLDTDTRLGIEMSAHEFSKLVLEKRWGSE